MTAIDPFDLALALHNLGRLAEAEAAYRALLAANRNDVRALTMLATVLLQREEMDAGVDLLRASLAIDPNQPSALINLGLALTKSRRLEEALAAFDQAIAQDRRLADAHIGRANALFFLARYEDALASYDGALALSPDDAMAHRYRAGALQELGRLDEAAISAARAVILDPDAPYALGEAIHTQLQIADWRDLDARLSALNVAIDAGKMPVSPFVSVTLPSSPARQLTLARRYVEREYPSLPPPMWPALRGDGKIRVGYFSSDFHAHATAHLIADLIERHDRESFEIIGISFGPASDVPMRRRLEAAFDHFVDIRSCSTDEAVALARGLHLDIAVDLKGFTRDARPDLFRARVAPVQVSYLGYPGTMGADFIDYLIADETIIPAGTDHFYAECIVRLPDSYQANDSTREQSAHVFTRADLNLPHDGFVFCCFNATYKITPDIFDVWMRLLQAVDNSVLWLLDTNRFATVNLRAEAAVRGVAPDRIVFAPRMPVDQHLARHPAADLFLDTLHYNAHTTASDSLWSGVPLVTVAGAPFAARVGASLLKAVGLPELITDSLAAYEALVLDLARDRQALTALRARLAAKGRSSALFDTPRFVRHVEAALREMHERRLAGRSPAPIQIPAGL